ncbi:HAMP domain-containing sensor histidine kinase [Eubacteriaceae bacterium ES3]|nr:HAMP domain-containing sensor histidine kinase [Eubacteriaceae bacterium ES3]
MIITNPFSDSPKKPRNISVKWKIFLFLLGFCGLLLVLLWLFQVVFLNNFYKSIKINEIKTAATTIEESINDEDLTSLIYSISHNNEICIELLDQEGEIIYSSHVLKNCIIHAHEGFEEDGLPGKVKNNDGELYQFFSQTMAELAAAEGIDLDAPPDSSENGSDYNQDSQNIEDESDQKTLPDDKHEGQNSIIYSKNIYDSQGSQYTLVLNSVISPVDATVNTLRVQLYYITGFMIFFSVILALILSKWISRPIEAINESAKVLATGDYSATFSGKGYKEITELSDTLNYTAKELSQVERLRQELIANISHDLRTPLTLISGYAEAMRDLPDENTPENAQIIVDETHRLTTLVNDVMDISKYQSGNYAVHMQPYNLTKSLSNTISRMNKLLQKDGYQIIFEANQDVTVIGDETRISQAFYNLVINAINYTGHDKSVTVVQQLISDQSQPLVKIEINDTGEGIEKDDLPYIWERYYKIDKTHKRAVTGTGLGLSIVRSIIEMHQGQYGVDSTVGQGSSFWFTLKTEI